MICAKAERSARQERLELAAKAYELCGNLERLSPLRDRFTNQAIAFHRFDAAILAERVDLAEKQSEVLTPPVYHEICKRLKQKAFGGGSVLLDCRIVYQKKDRCLPTSIASVAGRFGRQIDADELAGTLTYGGTPIWRAADWLRQHGYICKTFIATKDHCSALLSRGIAFVFAFDTSLDGSHATVALGIDEAAGMLICHDPSYERFARFLLDRLGESEFPLGPIGLAFAPVESGAVLDCIDEDDSRLGQLYQDAWQASASSDTKKLEEVVRQLQRDWPDTPVTQALIAHWQVSTHEIADGIAALEDLCRRYPTSMPLQRMLLGGLERTRNFSRVRGFLREIVFRGRLSGISELQIWDYPPASCITRFAELEGLTSEGAPGAIDLLLKLLTREPASAGAYYTLGNIRLRQGQLEEAVLQHHLASLLAPTDERLARAFFYSANLAGRTDDALGLSGKARNPARDAFRRRASLDYIYRSSGTMRRQDCRD